MLLSLMSASRGDTRGERAVSVFIGLDIGSSSVKASLFDGEAFSVVRASYQGYLDNKQQAAVQVAHAVQDACGKILAHTQQRPDEITGIGLSGHGPSILFLDGQGAVISPLVTWQDTRAAEEAQYLRNRIPGFTKDGTSYEAKLLWFHRHQPHCFNTGCTALYPKDYIIQLLTNERVVDVSTASTFAFYQRSRRTWNEDLMDFPSLVLPRVADSWECVGTTCTDFSRACGFPDGLKVYPGGIDAYCGAVGAGAAIPEIVVEETGTSTCVSRCYVGGQGKDLHVLPGLSLTMKVISFTGGSFQWYKDFLGERDVSGMLKAIKVEVPKQLLFLPYLIGERSPIWDEKALGACIGLRHDTSKEDFLQAIMQGTAFAIYQNIQLLEQNTGSIRVVHAVGGSAKDRAWLQMKAHITGKTYRQMKNIDASAIGAAIVAGVGAGAINVADIPSLVGSGGVDFEPDERVHALYAPLYDMYALLYERLRPVIHALHDA